MRFNSLLALIVLFSITAFAACTFDLGEVSADTDKNKTAKKRSVHKKHNSDISKSNAVPSATVEPEDEEEFEDYDDVSPTPPGATKADDYEENTPEFIEQNSGRIRFSKGKTSANIYGEVKSSKTNVYMIGARKGQTLSVMTDESDGTNDITFSVLTSKGKVILSGGSEFEPVESVLLPENGDYRIIVKSANGIDVEYKIYVSIE